MSLRLTFGLMILFMVLGTFAIFDPLRRQEKEEAQKDREAHVLWLKDKKLERLSFTGKDGRVELECSSKDGCAFDGTADWHLLQPIVDQADSSNVGSIASSLFNLNHNEKIEFEVAPEPAEFGFDKPQAEVSLTIKGEPEPYALKFGKASAVGPNVYLSVSRDPKHVFLVPSFLVQSFQVDAFHWRNKRFFPQMGAADVENMEWQRKGLAIKAKRVDKSWRLEAPIQARGADLILEGLVSTIVYAPAKSVFTPARTTPEAKKVLVGKPELEISLRGAKGLDVKLALYTKPASGKARGDEVRELFAVVSGKEPIYVVDATQFDRFTKDLMNYRLRSVLDGSQRNSMDEVRLNFLREKKELTFKFEKGEWVRSSGENPLEPISQKRLQSFFDGLRDADIKAFEAANGKTPAAVAFRTQIPDLEIEIKGEGKPIAQAKFLVFERKQVLTEGEGELRTLTDPLLRALPVRFVDLYESNNKQVVAPAAAKEEDDGHGHHSGDGHGH